MERTRKADLARVTIQGTFWNYVSNYGGKLLVFLGTVILARLLTKEDFGVAGYALVVITFLDVLNDLGVGAALIYHREKEGAAETAFWLSLGIGVTLFGLTWLIAPLAALFFNDDRAIPVVRALGLTFPIGALQNVHSNLLEKRLQFKRKFIPELALSSSKGIISVVLALLGFGAWSLIWGQLGGTLVSVIAYWWAMPWRPALRFSRQLARSLLSYGTRVVATHSIGMIELNVDYLFVGRVLGPAALGAYMLAFRVPELLIKQFCGVLSKVLFPVYVKMRDDPEALSRGFLTTMRFVTIITVPMALGLALVAEPFVLTVFGPKWVEAAAVMPAIAIYTLLRSLVFNVGSIYKAQGRPGLMAKLAIVRLVFLLPALWWAVVVHRSIVMAGWVEALTAFFGAVLSLSIAQRMLHTPFRKIALALRPAAIGGAIMTVAVLATLRLLAGAAPAAQLVVGIAVGVMVYSAALWWLQRDVVVRAGSTLRAALSRR